jgi:hypothetical protein
VAAYRLYHIDGAGSFAAAEWVEAEDDAAAVRAAHAMKKSVACELWQGSRLIARIEPEAK